MRSLTSLSEGWAEVVCAHKVALVQKSKDCKQVLNASLKCLGSHASVVLFLSVAFCCSWDLLHLTLLFPSDF